MGGSHRHTEQVSGNKEGVMTERKRVTNYELLQQFKHLADDFKEFKRQYNIDMRGDKEFKEQYETDMRGDKGFTGNIGIMGEIRELRRMVQEYPSLLWLLRHETKKKPRKQSQRLL
jgi:hypothetical protein